MIITLGSTHIKCTMKRIYSPFRSCTYVVRRKKLNILLYLLNKTLADSAKTSRALQDFDRFFQGFLRNILVWVISFRRILTVEQLLKKDTCWIQWIVILQYCIYHYQYHPGNYTRVFNVFRFAWIFTTLQSLYFIPIFQRWARVFFLSQYLAIRAKVL